MYSVISAQVKLARTKLHYLIEFGLAKCYKEKIFSSLLTKAVLLPIFASCFDEAFISYSFEKEANGYACHLF